MKIISFTSVIVILIFTFYFIHARNRPGEKELSPAKRHGTAVVMTGAAARIPQEAALLEELYKRGNLNNVEFISGVSSGALNAVILNGILEGKITFEEYKEVLFNLNDSDIFIQDGRKLPVNTEPARKLFTYIVEDKLGYYTIGDLPYMTEISFTHIGKFDLRKSVYRMCSRKINEETDTTLSLVDIMMASISFPIAFPPVKIRNVETIPDVDYIDGGVGDDHVPFQALLDFEKFRGAGIQKVYFISRKNDSIPAVSQELKVLGINDRGVFDKLGISIDNILMKGIIKRLEAYAAEAPELVPYSYIWIPDFDQNFLMFSFSNLKEQYELTTQWAKTNNPVPLAEYLLKQNNLYLKSDRISNRTYLKNYWMLLK